MHCFNSVLNAVGYHTSVDVFVMQDFPILCQTCLGDNPYIRMVSTVQTSDSNNCICILYSLFLMKFLGLLESED